MEQRQSIILLVKRAIGDEWLAITQYWADAILIDAENEDVIDEFVEHRDDETDHANELGFWLQDIPCSGGIPKSLDEILKNQTCGYVYPSGHGPNDLLQDTIRAEKCAVEFYSDFIRVVRKSEFKGDLGPILDGILEKEKEHLRDLERL